jgi:Fe-Mn family superoxide dismutase
MEFCFFAALFPLETTMPHTLPPLRYDLDALEPVISAETLHLHHAKHHRGYVDKLNAALIDHPQYLAMPVELLLQQLKTLPAPLRTPVRNFGGGHANHSLFWDSMGPSGHAPSSAFLTQISEPFGSLVGLQKSMQQSAEGLFGSGWTFLNRRGHDGQLEIVSLPNQDSPLSEGSTPLLAFDLWEHAYYLQYHQERSRWMQAWWTVVDWSGVEQRWTEASARRAA